MSKNILVTSEKARIGKSLVCLKLAYELSRNNKKVVVIEYSNSDKIISDYFDLNEEIIYNVNDIMNNYCDVEQCTCEIISNIDILPAPKLKTIKLEQNIINFKKVLKKLEEKYDFVIVEVSDLKNCFMIEKGVYDVSVILNNNNITSIDEINMDYMLSEYYTIHDKFIIINKYNMKKELDVAKLNMKDFRAIFPKKLLSFVDLNENDIVFDRRYCLTDVEDELTFTLQQIVKTLLI